MKGCDVVGFSGGVLQAKAAGGKVRGGWGHAHVWWKARSPGTGSYRF